MKRRVCSYDVLAVPDPCFVLKDTVGEMYFCNLRCFCVWSVLLATRPNLSVEVHLLTLHGPPEDCSFDRYLGSTTNNVKNNNLENERRPEAEGHDGLGGNDDVAIAGVGACDCAGTRT